MHRRKVTRNIFSLLVCFALLTCPNSYAFDKKTASEAYKDYVDQAIPLSFETANRKALANEIGLFFQLTSDAQSILSQTSESLAVYGELTKLIEPGTCHVDTEGSVNLEKALNQKFIVNQMITYLSRARTDLNEYRKIEESIPNACERGFDEYKVKDVHLEHITPDLELADGAYIMTVAGAGPEAAIVAFVLTLAFTIWKSIENANEISAIEEHRARFLREQAKDADYRRFAKQQCQSITPVFKKTFEEYERLAKAYDAVLNNIPLSSLEKRQKNLNRCIHRFSDQLIAKLERRARAQVEKKLKAKDDHDTLASMSIKANFRIDKGLDELSKTPCGEGRTLLEGLKADVVLARIYKLPFTQSKIPLVEKALKNRNAVCSGELSVTNFEGLPSSSSSTTFKWTPNSVEATRSHLINSKSLGKSASKGVYETASSFKMAGRSNRRALDSALAVYLSRLNVSVPPIRTCMIGGGYAFGDFCSDLQRGPTSGNGYTVQSSGTGGICHTAQSSAIGNFSLCNGNSAFLYGGWGGGGVWDVARTIIASANYLPGQYALARGEIHAEILEKHLIALRKTSSQLLEIQQGILEGHGRYLSATITPAVNESIATANNIATVNRDRVSPILDSEPTPLPGIEPDTNISPIDVASDPLRNLSTRLTNLRGNPKELWKELESVWQLQHTRLSEISLPDRRGVGELYNKYFDSNGIVNDQVVGEQWSQAAGGIGRNIETDSGSVEGREIRYQMNRGLVAASGTSDPEYQQHAVGSLTIIAGADRAYAEGYGAEGNRLLTLGAKTTDFVLGFIPGVSSINDAVQLVYGMATGRDYTGAPMHAADFALRGLGIIAGVVPGGGQIVKIGGKALGAAFRQGARLLRQFNLASRFHSATTAARHLAAEFVERIGYWFPPKIADGFQPAELAANINRVIEPDLQVIKNAASGSAFEGRVLGVLGAPKNYERILQGDATDVAYRIPDILNTSERVFGEIKAVKDLSLTGQLRDFINFSKQTDFSFRLYVRPDTTLSMELRTALKEIGAIVYEVNEKGDVIQRSL